MKVGDVVTTYNKGIHKIIKIDKRFYKSESEIPSGIRSITKIGDEASPLVTYVRIMKEDGQYAGSSEKQCDAAYCKPVKEFMDQKEEELKLLRKHLGYV